MGLPVERERYRFTVEEYHRLGEAGILGEDDEVADSSVGYDRGTKMPLYGRTGIPEVWIVDLRREVVDAYLEPFSGGYRQRRTYGREDRLALPGLEAALEVGAMLP